MLKKWIFVTAVLLFAYSGRNSAEPNTYTFHGEIEAQFVTPNPGATYDFLGKPFSLSVTFDTDVYPSDIFPPVLSITKGVDWTFDIDGVETSFSDRIGNQFGEPQLLIENNRTDNFGQLDVNEIGVYDLIRVLAGGTQDFQVKPDEVWKFFSVTIMMVDNIPTGNPDGVTGLELPLETPHVDDFSLNQLSVPTSNAGVYVNWRLVTPTATEFYSLRGKLNSSPSLKVDIPVLPYGAMALLIISLLIVGFRVATTQLRNPGQQ